MPLNQRNRAAAVGNELFSGRQAVDSAPFRTPVYVCFFVVGGVSQRQTQVMI
jgi:hypothetical protein